MYLFVSLFFFFKQKTAYEMRISDWSSDVCSSDLIAVTAEVASYAHTKGVAVEGELGTIGGSEDGRIRTEIVLADPDKAVEFVERTGVDVLEIGRASGRERVWQYG